MPTTMMRVLVAVVAMLAGGCDRVFGLHSRDADTIDVDGTRPPPCLADTFDAQLEETRWNARRVANGTVAATGSQLELVLPAGIIDFAGVSSVGTYDLSGGTVSLEVATAASGPNTELFFSITRDPENYYLFDVRQGQLYFTAGFEGRRYIGDVVYDPALHRFWQIRHDVATDLVVFDTSPDGTNWDQQHVEPARTRLEVMQVGAYMNTFAVETNPQTSRLDDVRMSGPGCIAP